jgi:hypothetical protein
VAGQLRGELVHGYSPFYGTVVYLIPITTASKTWWHRFAGSHLELIDPIQNSSVAFRDRTVAAQDGSFSFHQVPPGSYYLYGRVLWASTAKDTTSFGGDAWLGTASVSTGDTTHVVLRNRRAVFPPDSIHR